MKKMKKFLAMLLAMIMVLGMSVTVFAEEGKREQENTATVTIEGIEAKEDDSYPTVTLYQIAKGDYDGDFKGFLWAEGVSPKTDDKTNTTYIDIAEVAGKLLSKGADKIEAWENDTETGVVEAKPVADGKFEATVHAGAYIAVISGGGKTIYNPILLTAAYGDSTDLVGGSVNTEGKYNELFGSSAVAKISKPDIKKDMDGTTPDGEKGTASVGDTITYTVTPTMPSYPLNAVNKTAFIEDNMAEGLTFDFDTLQVKLGGTAAQKSTADDVVSFSKDGVVVAKAIKVQNGFRLVFLYGDKENPGLADTATGAVPAITVEYSAQVNTNAVVGGDGNTNTATLTYSNNPNEGSSYENPSEDPTNLTGVEKITDTKTVYTYQLALEKVDEKDHTKKLPGAVFGIYDKDGKLVDKVVTNKNGIAVSTKVKAGTYTVKEIAAPSGYTLDPTEKTVEVNWSKATTITTSTTRTWTTYAKEEDVPEEAEQIGWERNGVFYAMDEYQESDLGKVEGLQKAYLVGAATTSDETTLTADSEGGSVTFEITNTKLTALPSTGGIGTTIFTIGGCAIMILAAGLYFATRRKTVK